MNLLSLSFVAGAIFLCSYLLLIFAFTKSDEKIQLWSLLVIAFFIIILGTWWSEDMALQWVLIEGTTLIGALLISLSRTEKSIDVAWKFLLLNSFGLGIAFLGIIILSFGLHSTVTTNIPMMISQIADHQNILVETGLWLVVFGYTTKLGLFPNHFWVSDTYAESPSQISTVISSFLPVAVAIAIRPLIEMDLRFSEDHFSSSKGLLILGTMTMIYSLWTVYQTHDIRRITAQMALFHTGALAVFLYLNPSDSVFYYGLAANVAVKALLFSAMGIFRIDAGTRDLAELKIENGLNRASSFLYIASVCIAFVVPFSPFFIMDLLILKIAFFGSKYWILFLPVISVIFFLVILFKILPILNVEDREYLPEHYRVLRIRTVFTWVILLVTIGLGVYGFWVFGNGGFNNV